MNSNPTNNIIIFTGDALSHDGQLYNTDQDRQYNAHTGIFKQVTAKFNVDDIFWVNGNNDLEHTEPCEQSGA